MLHAVDIIYPYSDVVDVIHPCFDVKLFIHVSTLILHQNMAQKFDENVAQGFYPFCRQKIQVSIHAVVQILICKMMTDLW